MSQTATTVRPYNPTKKLSASNYQAMPYLEASSSNDYHPQGSAAAEGENSSTNNKSHSNKNQHYPLPQSPASTWKSDMMSSNRKDSESTANLSSASPASRTDSSSFSSPHQQCHRTQLSNLSAQLAAETSVVPEEEQGPLQQQQQEPNLSIRDMFEKTAGDNDLDEYFTQNNNETPPSTSKNATPLHSLWNPLTPPSSLGGTPPVGPVASSPGMNSSPLLAAPAKMIGPSGTGAAKEQGSSGNSLSSSPMPQRPAVLYSAIGSLEDPSNQSFQQSRWNKKKNPSAATQKYEFPVQAHLLIPPPNLEKKKVAATTTTTTTPSATSSSNRNNASKKSCMSELLGAAAGPKPPPGEAKQEDAAAKTSALATTTTTTNTSSTEEENMELNQQTIKASNLKLPGQKSDKNNKSVKIAVLQDANKKKVKRAAQPKEQFRPSSDAYTPRMGKKEIKYKPAEKRTPVQQMSSGLGTLSRPNFRDALRRVAMILRQHIVKIERRFESHMTARGRDGLFMQSMKEEFSEDRFATPTYKVTMVRVPMARGGMVGGLKMVRKKHEIPSESEIYDFAHRLFKTVQLSSECSIVCLIYIERLMEVAKVPLLASTWRPIVMCGLLLASKVWQDLSSWNIEFATVYPQYSLDAIHRLELQFLRMVKWDLYISSTLYAKYYFALRALVSKVDFRQRYNRMVGGVDSVQAAEARKIEERSTLVKEEALLQLSRSM